VAPEGHKLIGIDMPSAHPRLLADFTQNETFIAAVDGKEEEEDGTYVGKDFHTVNSVLFELNTKDDVEEARRSQDKGLLHTLGKGRKKGKGGSYCTLYGGSDKKLALTIGIEQSKGARLKKQFLAGLGLDILLAEIEATWDEMKHGRGSYIAVLGGYVVWCSSKHKIINYKALGSEAVVQKVAVVLLCRKLRDLGLKTKLILNVHDEVLLEVPDDEVERMRKIGSQMYVEAAKVLGLTLDWTSVAKVGINYAVCH
jgi:DNA polymerase-1